MFRKITICLILALLAGTAWADDYGLVYHEVQVVDEGGEDVTTISSVNIYGPDTTTSQTIYKNRNKQNAITLPMTTTETNTTLVDGSFYWWGPDGYDFSITDGTNVAANADHRTRTASEGTLVFPSYLTAISSSAYLDAQTITFGTDLDWVANAGTSADRMTWTPLTDSTSAFWIGSTAKTADLNVWGATAGYDLMWDASRNQFSFRDSAVLGFGGAAASAAADFTISHTAGSSKLVITAVVADETVVFGDETIATDVKFDNTTTAGADVWWDDSTETWHYGVTNTGVDVKFWGDTASTFALWDEDADEMVFDLADLKIHEGSQIEFYHTDTVDWTIDIATGDRLLFSPALTNDTANIHLGDATNTSDLALFGATASTVLFDATADRVLFDVYDIEVYDTSNLYIGSDDEFAIDNSSETLRIIPSDTDDDFAMHLGSANNTMDVLIYGKTASELITWDAGNDSLTVVGDLMLVTATGTTVPIRLDATGTVSSGNAIEIETTDGRVLINADGGTYGDIELNSADDIVLTTAGKLTITNTEATTVSGDLTVTGTLTAVGAYVNPFEIAAATNEIEITESGTTFILNHGTEFATTLPTVATSAGVTFRFIVGVDPAGSSFTIVTDSLEDAIEGVVVVNGAAVAADGPDDTITFTASAAVVGDWCELTSDGVLWYLSGQAVAATGIVPTKAD